MVTSEAGRVTAMSPPSHEPFVAIRARANPAVFLPALWRQRQLIRQLTWREVTGRYRTSLLGLFWSFVMPIMPQTGASTPTSSVSLQFESAPAFRMACNLRGFGTRSRVDTGSRLAVDQS